MKSVRTHTHKHKMPIGFAVSWPCEPQAQSRSVKAVLVAEVNDAYTHGRYENISLKSLFAQR